MASQVGIPEKSEPAKQSEPKRALARRGVRCGPSEPRAIARRGRSKLNAVKHGIFACGLLIQESEKEYQELWQGLADWYKPLGKLEEILVEKLAMTLWRYRRLLSAEAAEIEQEIPPGDMSDVRHKRLVSSLFASSQGMIHQAILTHNESLLSQAVEEMASLKKAIRERGLDWKRDQDALEGICGRSEGSGGLTIGVLGEGDDELAGRPPSAPLARLYHDLACQAANAESAEARKEAAEEFLTHFDSCFETLDEMEKEWLEKFRARRHLRGLAALVPRQKATEKLQRYEATLERAFDRTLNQLERLQRIRLGHAVPPPLKVELYG